MYRRLKGAGIFYKVLNTPPRIDAIEKMGRLDREDADFLRATFYRTIDHGLRISTGHAGDARPPSRPAPVREAGRDPPADEGVLQPRVHLLSA